MVDLDDLKATLAKMTPGPWVVARGDKLYSTDPDDRIDAHHDAHGVWLGTPLWSTDAEGIVALVNAAPALIAQLEQAERERDVANHGLSLISARVGERGATDCSTPLHIQVENVVARLEQAEARLAKLDAMLEVIDANDDPAQRIAELEAECERRAVETGLASRRVREVEAELAAVRELMNTYNLGGWTDAVAPMRRAAKAEAECERKARGYAMVVDELARITRERDEYAEMLRKTGGLVL